MLDGNEIEIYKEILEGKRKRFPKYFWENNKKEKAIIIFKYLFEEVLKWGIEKLITDFNYEVVVKYKLTTPYNKIYGKSIGNILRDIYPDSIKGERLPMSNKARKRMSVAQKNMSAEKRANITRGARENRYCEEYAKKISDSKLGELNPQHKLNAEQVREIKKLYTTGNYSIAGLGKQFGVGRQTVSDIIHGRTWKYV